MKRDIFWRFALMALCVLALLAASSPRSVMVFHTGDKTVCYDSLFSRRQMHQLQFACSLPDCSVE